MTPHVPKMIGGTNRDRFWLRWEGFETHKLLSTVYNLEHLDAWKRPEDVRELRQVLVHVRTLQAQDPLDRLYSMYTILQRFCPGFPTPDYSISPSTLWASATSAVIQSMRCLDLILDVQPDEGGNLPSWSFDWSLQYWRRKNVPWLVPDDLLDSKRPAGTPWDQAPKFDLVHESPQRQTLQIKGKIYTKVAKRSTDQNEGRAWYRDIYSTLEDPEYTQEMSNLLDEGTQILFEWAIPRVGAEPSLVDAEELCRHLIIWDIIPGEDSFKAFNTWFPHMRRLQWLQADDALNEPDDVLAGLVCLMLQTHGEGLAKRFHGQVCLTRLFRCFFVTDDGRIGDGLHTVREGDLVVLFCWSKVPAIIRPTAEDSSLYKLVSFVYIQDLVDCHAWDLKEEELEEFTLV